MPTAGTVVDIGTAQGGSAFIFHQATAGRRVAIHTYDPQPSREAYTHLAGTGVTICAQTSIEGARAWRDRRPVDLLFIDGSHHLIDVIDDFNSWLPHLSPQGTVAFHDYDSVERGGLIEMCRDRQAFFKWEEVLAPLAGVSAFVAREQVRLVCLAAMFDAITGHRL